jgi:hypothetical protein
MSQSESQMTPIQLNVVMADDTHLPLIHVNVLSARGGGLDEFYCVLGIAVPPAIEDLPATQNVGHIVAQPVFRFAISRETMAKFLASMTQAYDQQTAIIQQLRSVRNEVSEDDQSDS